MGAEFAQESEWTESRSLDWDILRNDPQRQGVHGLIRDLSCFYRESPALYGGDAEPTDFEWIDCNDRRNAVISFLRRDPRGLRFTQNLVGNLRRSWDIPRCTEPTDSSTGDLMSIRQRARELGIAASTIHRWVKDGFIAGEQLTPGAPWQVRVNDALRRRLVQQAPEGYLPMQEATKLLGVTRQTVSHRVKRGELEAVLLYQGRRKGLRIKASYDNPGLFDRTS
jgi:transposase